MQRLSLRRLISIAISLVILAIPGVAAVLTAAPGGSSGGIHGFGL